MRMMGEIIEKLHVMEKECMSSWLKEKELQKDIIEKDLMDFAHWLLKEE